LHNTFNLDWSNHLWLVGYHSEFYRQHGRMPLALDTPQFGGAAFPLFYGCLFYQVLGWAGTYLNPEVVVRGAAVLLLAAQWLMARRALCRLGASDGLAASMACLLTWAIYPLTNLYSRSALPEFFAVGLLTCALCAWVGLVRASRGRQLARRSLVFGLCYTLAAGSHPITALYSLPLLALLACTLVVWRPRLPRRQLLAALAACALLGLIVLSPWCYVLVKFRSGLSITRDPVIHSFPESLDWWATRLAPLPFDRRALWEAPARVSTPYLDAQINVPLLLLVGALALGVLRACRGWRRLWAVCLLAAPLGYSGACLGLSVRPHWFEHLPQVAKMLQYSYRLVTYVNFGLLLAVFVLLRLARDNRSDPTAGGVRAHPILLCFLLTLSGCGVALKLLHAHVARVPDASVAERWARHGLPYTYWSGGGAVFKGQDYGPRLAEAPRTFLCFRDYMIPTTFPPLSEPEGRALRPAPLPVQGGNPFGLYGALQLHFNQAGFAGTQVLPFPWCSFRIDGLPVPAETLRTWPGEGLGGWEGPRVAVPVPAGSHRLEYHFEPTRSWRVLSTAGRVALLGWVGAIVALHIPLRLRGARREAAPSAAAAAHGPWAMGRRTLPEQTTARGQARRERCGSRDPCPVHSGGLTGFNACVNPVADVPEGGQVRGR
jgi:hypothetical protein